MDETSRLHQRLPRHHKSTNLATTSARSIQNTPHKRVPEGNPQQTKAHRASSPSPTQLNSTQPHRRQGTRLTGQPVHPSDHNTIRGPRPPPRKTHPVQRQRQAISAGDPTRHAPRGRRAAQPSAHLRTPYTRRELPFLPPRDFGVTQAAARRPHPRPRREAKVHEPELAVRPAAAAAAVAETVAAVAARHSLRVRGDPDGSRGGGGQRAVSRG